MIDLAEEYALATAAAMRADYDFMIDRGVPRDFLYGGACRFGVAKFDVADDGLYQPAPDGELAFLLPALPNGQSAARRNARRARSRQVQDRRRAAAAPVTARIAGRPGYEMSVN